MTSWEKNPAPKPLPMTAFEREVCTILVRDGSESQDTVRHILVERARKAGKRCHPAAVSCNLTKLACRETFVRSFWTNNIRYLAITAAGREALKEKS